ncbi:hypothetical protein SAMN05216206_1457 [Pseudomonas guineae]|uniref:Secreted protein n=1 Tax=Pseudomonas guineae TaxID=425504 RepID=A0A1I3FH13_9PSED|nr:hypothetical protein SAMN05216206_1457 [Pseudomonas guineae]
MPCVTLLAMCSSTAFSAPSACATQLSKRRHCAAQHSNATLPKTLAFWALWHCRHARPPDASHLVL